MTPKTQSACIFALPAQTSHSPVEIHTDNVIVHFIVCNIKLQNPKIAVEFCLLWSAVRAMKTAINCAVLRCINTKMHGAALLMRQYHRGSGVMRSFHPPARAKYSRSLVSQTYTYTAAGYSIHTLGTATINVVFTEFLMTCAFVLFGLPPLLLVKTFDCKISHKLPILEIQCRAQQLF